MISCILIVCGCHQEGLRYLMHIYIIAQYLNLQGPGEDRFLKLGRYLTGQGDKVTIFTGTGGVDFSLNRKKIGLYQDSGITMVVLNAPYRQQMNNLQKLRSYMKFSRMVGRQGRLLPKPDLLLVSTPPLSTVIPAVRLKKEYNIPLVVEVRELWPDALIQRGTLKNRLLIKGARNLEQMAYREAKLIIAAGVGIGEAVKNCPVEGAKIATIPDGLAETDLLQRYKEAMSNLRSSHKKNDEL